MAPTDFTLDGEHETPNGWLYTFTLQHDRGSTHHELTLSWVDHEHLIGGSVAPEHVAKATFKLALDYFKDELPAKFDVSSLRRRIDDFDIKLRSSINAPL